MATRFSLRDTGAAKFIQQVLKKPVTPKLDDIEGLIDGYIGRMRSIDIRDGVQSWDRNQVPINDIVTIGRKLDAFVVEGKKRRIDMAPMEVWGGGQFMQPANALGEDPFCNMQDIKSAMPNTKLQSLFRGRQGLGFEPVSEEVLHMAVNASADVGNQGFRVFDMMNDTRNLEASYRAFNAQKKLHPERGTYIEGAMSYMAPAANGEAAMMPDDYGRLAVWHARQGADAVIIKDYAGVGEKELAESVVPAIRKQLNKAGFKRMAINLHSHGQKPGILADVMELKNGVQLVDVAIGDLAGGPSHTDMRSLVNELLERKGYNLKDEATADRINHHPMMQKLAEVEATIHEVIHRERGTAEKPWSFDSKRGVLKTLQPEDARRYRVALGAYTDPLTRIDALYKDGKPPAPFYPSRDEYFKRTLQKAEEMWAKGGQYNTVTPGAKITCEQAIELVRRDVTAEHEVAEWKKKNAERYGERVQGAVKSLLKDEGVHFPSPLTTDKARPRGEQVVDAQLRDEVAAKYTMRLKDWRKDYVDLVAGRYGRNAGLEKGLVDKQWLDSVLMHRALEKMETAFADNPGHLTTFAVALNNELPPGKNVALSYTGTKATLLGRKDIEEVLGRTSIDHFRQAVKQGVRDPGLRDKLLYELSYERFPDKTTGLEVGQAVLKDIKDKSFTGDPLDDVWGARISKGERAELLATMLHNSAAQDPDGGFKTVFNKARNDVWVAINARMQTDRLAPKQDVVAGILRGDEPTNTPLAGGRA